MLPSRRTMVSGHVERARRRGIAGLLTVLVLAAATRMLLLERQGLWTDELFSLAMATGHGLEHTAAEANAALGDFVEQPDAVAPAVYASYFVHDPAPAGPGRVVRAVWRSDTNPPLYYLLLNGWTRVFGTSDAALRAFSVAASLACFPFLWRLGRAVGGRTGAISTLLLFAVVPPSVYYSTEGRMYSLLWLFTVALMWQTWVLWRAGARPLSVLVWISMGAAGLLTHYFFACVWVAAILWLWLYPGRATRRSLALGVALTAIVVLPWYVRAPASLEAWRVTGGWLQIRPAYYSALQAALLQPWRFLTLRVGAAEETRWNYVNLALYAGLGAAFLTTGGSARCSLPRGGCSCSGCSRPAPGPRPVTSCVERTPSPCRATPSRGCPRRFSSWGSPWPGSGLGHAPFSPVRSSPSAASGSTVFMKFLPG